MTVYNITYLGHDVHVLFVSASLSQPYPLGLRQRLSSFEQFNPLHSNGNYSATSNNTKLVHWPLMSGLLHLVQRLALPNVTALSTASVPNTVLLHDGPLL